jgi:hypothetical protein
MAKKKSALRKSQRVLPRSLTGSAQPTGTSAAVAPAVSSGTGISRPLPTSGSLRRAAAATRPAEQRSQAPLSQEYHYVAGDLRRLALLTLGTAVVMVVLGVIVR